MTKSILKKIWRDLAERKWRTLLTLLGQIIGLWGLASVIVAWAVLRNDMPENFQMTSPPAIVMETEGPGPLVVADLGSVEGVEYIENRPQIMTRVQVTPDELCPFPVWVIDDFANTNVAKVFHDSGPVTPPLGEIMIERDAVYLAWVKRRLRQLAVEGPEASRSDLIRFENDTVQVKLRGGRTVAANIAGVVHDPAQAAAHMENVLYGYITRETADLWLDGDVTDRLIVRSAQGYETDDAVLETAARLIDRLAELGHSVLNTTFPSTTRAVHQFQVDSVLFLLGGVGLLGLLTSMVLVLNLINAILTSQIRQIGILKAIGASTSKVATIYLGSMVILGLIASLVAVPMALKSGYVMIDAMSFQMNYEVLTTEPPAFLILALGLIGVAFPVLAAFLPVRRWTRVSVTDALQHFGVNPKDESGAKVDKLLFPLSINVRMGIRNAFRKPQRTLLTAFTLGVGVLCFMVAMNTRSSLDYTATVEETQLRFDVVVSFEEPIDPLQVDWLDDFALVEAAETWKAKSANILDENGQALSRGVIYVVPEGSEMLVPIMTEGVWINEGRPGLVVNHKVEFEHPDMTVGSNIALRVGNDVLELPIIGKFKEYGRSKFYVNDATFKSLVSSKVDRVNLAFVGLEDSNERNLAELMRSLEKHFAAEGIHVSGLTSAKVASRVLRNHIDIIMVALIMLALLMLSISSLGMASGISSSVVERTREIGILRAIGGKPRAIFSILSSEALVMALIGWLVALVLAQPLSRFLTEYFGTALVEYPFDYMGSLEAVLYSLAITIFLAALATVGPARMVSRQSVKDAVGYD